ncbi:MAG: ketose-bisphosphate aldolase [Mycoplasmatales bacterium]
MLINMNEMLKIAKEEKFGVPAFNIGSEVMLKGVMQECEAQNAPVILAIHPSELDFFGDDFAKMCVSVAKSSKLPVVVHLDHGGSIKDVVRAISCGFSSVMIDASLHSLEENIVISKEVVKICQENNISVEGEIGTIGNNDGSFEGTTRNIIYTDPKDVIKFVNETGIDTLAVAIGTAHGLYPKNMEPKLRLDILEEIVKIATVPLVLHGGSGNKDDEIHKAVKIGVQKVNISSDYKSVLYKCSKKMLDENPGMMEPNEIYPSCIVEFRKVIKHKLELLEAVNQADKYEF